MKRAREIEEESGKIYERSKRHVTAASHMLEGLKRAKQTKTLKGKGKNTATLVTLINGMRRQLKNDEKHIRMIQRNAKQTLERRTGSTSEKASFNKMLRSMEDAGHVIRKCCIMRNDEGDVIEEAKAFIAGYNIIEMTAREYLYKPSDGTARKARITSKLHEHLLGVFQMTHRMMCRQGAAIIDDDEKTKSMYRCHRFCKHMQNRQTLDNYKEMFETAESASHTYDMMFKEALKSRRERRRAKS